MDMQQSDPVALPRPRKKGMWVPVWRHNLCCGCSALGWVVAAVVLALGYVQAPLEVCGDPVDSYLPAALEVGSAAVATDSAVCSEMGSQLLQSGGNAVDAAVTTALCLGVVHPHASGLGGGCFILVHMPNASGSGHNASLPSNVTEVIDAREEAPAAAHQTMFVGKPGASLLGGLAIGGRRGILDFYSVRNPRRLAALTFGGGRFW
jgi:hypothetical protein